MNSKIEVSILFPVYNEEHNILPLVNRIETVMSNIGSSYEIVIIDNGSTDSSPKILSQIIEHNPLLTVITLTRNFGYDSAIAAGLENTQGNWTIIMDGDQQDPPEEIPHFIQKAKEGYDIVYGLRKKRTEGHLLGTLIKLFYRILNQVSETDIPEDAGNFGIISRKVVDTINRFPERNKFIRGLRAWTGYPATGIVYQRVDRASGETKFSFSSYLAYAVNSITSF